uniref:UBR-type domain-containing protein n=1 Tax=Macrostomum lignano TaxID=282301 RepID=A0A1I8IZV3_9PLAT
QICKSSCKNVLEYQTRITKSNGVTTAASCGPWFQACALLRQPHGRADSNLAELQQLLKAVISPDIATAHGLAEDSPNRQRLLAAVTVAVAAAQRPEFAAFSARSESLSGCADAVRTAERGFFRDADSPERFVCFHCAAECSGSPTAAATAEHRDGCA